MMLKINNVDILYNLVQELEGDCTLLFIGDDNVRAKDMKHFVLLHNTSYKKISDFVNMRKLVKNRFKESCKVSFITIQNNDDDDSEFKKGISNKALEIKFN